MLSAPRCAWAAGLGLLVVAAGCVALPGRSLSEPDWEATYDAPWGPIRAGDLFASWVAHDLLHMRQLVELHWAYTTAALAPYKPDYAGVW